MRLDKYLAETAQCTRSEAKTMLTKGRVQVNGAVCKKGDTQLKDTDTVAVDGALLTYQNADGGFCHERGGETNLMASEQAVCALASLVRAERGESSFYRMAALTQPAA